MSWDLFSKETRTVRYSQATNLRALGGHLPEVRLWGNPWKGVLALHSGFRGVDSGLPDSVPVELGFWITGSRIQDSLECVRDFQNQGFRIQQQILLDSGFSQVKIFRIP